MSIVISFEDGKFSVKSQFSSYNDPVTLTEDENTALELLKTFFEEQHLDFNTIKLHRRTTNYLTLLVGEHNDFLRMKIGSRSKWISVDMYSCEPIIKDDPRLINVENKNQRHWKIKLSEINDLQNYSDIIISIYKSAVQKEQ